jgi:hypothetical protein
MDKGEDMKKDMEIQTPILANVTAVGAKLVGTVPGWIDPEEICGIISGIESIPKLQKKTGGEAMPGTRITTLITKGGQRIMALGQAAELRSKIRQALGMKSEPAPQEQAE